jgi:D-glycero-beta-D-manno-heptose-7-phosphate kinase
MHDGVVEVADRPTTTKTRIMARPHQVARYDQEIVDPVGADCAEALVAAIERLAPRVDAIALEDYDKGVLVTAVIEAALDVALRHGKPVVVDPKLTHFFAYRGATIFKPNQTELEAALRGPALVSDPEWLHRTRRRLDCAHMLVTLGEQGMALAVESGEYFHVPAVARSVYDVSGAGDTVTAFLAVALAAGAEPLEAAVLANHAAGVEVGKPGVTTVSPDELRQSIRDHADRLAVLAHPEPRRESVLGATEA